MMTSPILIKTTPLSYRVPVTPGGFLTGTSVSMADYVQPLLEWDFDPISRRWTIVRKYRYYNAKTHELYLPLYDLPRFLVRLDTLGIPWVQKPLPVTLGKAVEIPIRPGMRPRDALQEGAVDYLATSLAPVRGLAMQTGKGKTATVLFGLSRLGRRGLIAVPGMLEQWTKAIESFTLLKPEDIYVVQGQNSVFKLMAQIDKKLFPKIILGSISTLRNYCLDKDSFVNCPTFDDLCRVWDVGVRCTDESHLNFHANLMMDLRLTPAVTIVVTATFDNSKPDVKKIFDGHYPVGIRYGENEYHRYTDVYAYAYRTGVGDIPSHAYKAEKGYSQVKWESWLLRRGKHKLRQITEDIYMPLLRSHYALIAQPGERCLILCDTVAMCEYFLKECQATFPDKTCAIYIQETDDDVLDTTDIIISTPKSAGTGRDIKNLLTVLVTTSVRSQPLNEQMLGRLRELPGRVPQFVYAYNTAIPPHVSHAIERAAIFQPLARNFYSLQL